MTAQQALVLTKLNLGQSLELKKVPELKVLRIDLIWSMKTTDGPEFDLDLCALFLDENDKCITQTDGSVGLLFWDNLKSADGAMWRTKDALTGGAESMWIDLTKAVDPRIKRIQIVATIWDAERRKQTFGKIKQAEVKLVNETTREQIGFYDLDENYESSTAILLGYVTRQPDNSFKLKALGEGASKGLEHFLREAGINATVKYD